MAIQSLKRTLTTLKTLILNPNSNLVTLNPPKLSQFIQLNYLSIKTLKSTFNLTQYLITRHQLSPEAATSAATIVTNTRNYKKCDLILDYFKNIGFSISQINDLLTCDARFLGCDFDGSIKPKVESIKTLGLSKNEFIDLLTNVPDILVIQRDPDRIVSRVRVLQGLLGCNGEVVKLLGVCDWFLSSDLDKTMLPNIELMESCGVCKSQIRPLVFNFPRFFLHRTEFLRECVKRVDELGLSRDSRMYVHGLRAISSMSLEKWEGKFELFKSLGFSYDDVLSVFRRTPQVFAVSERKIREVTELLVTKGNVDISFVVQHAELLIYSASRRIKPRLQIIGVLKTKSLLGKDPSLVSVCKMPEENFMRKFVVPYVSEIGEVGEKYLASRK